MKGKKDALIWSPLNLSTPSLTVIGFGLRYTGMNLVEWNPYCLRKKILGSGEKYKKGS